MDITQPDSEQQQPDDRSGGNDGDPSTPAETTKQTPGTFAQTLQAVPQSPQTRGPEAQPIDGPQRFADVLAAVDEVEGRPLVEHKDVFTRAHRDLTDALNDVERGDS